MLGYFPWICEAQQRIGDSMKVRLGIVLFDFHTTSQLHACENQRKGIQSVEVNRTSFCDAYKQALVLKNDNE